ncbi:hypothetical protein AMK16_19070 [Streptomyces sp. CB00455]|uniref:hypothetical protein n=1 Tax=Streptomyces sp. CB00455 TaxID=1703927 RepID=UPI00093D1432|nr:hypothetical protein [Streptomyces sp. CB00455]OKK18410.1 hypothetical protein AMK16_19070 [Streptomyces sp. CB00455]
MRDDHPRPAGPGEEDALRGLLRGAVEGLEPSDGALERLRYAVPARRTLRRQALVGAAAVALLAGTAIPAALHLTAGEGGAPDRSAIAGHGEPGAKPSSVPSDPHQNGSGAHPRSARSGGGASEAGGLAGGQPSPQASVPPAGGVSAGPSDPGGSTGPVAGTQAPAAAPGAPGCGAEQLGVVGSARAPGTDGKVYGSFKVTNVSAQGCTVAGPDTVTAAVAAGAQAGSGSGLTVVGHTAGDPASGLLPDPSAQDPVLVLQPNTAYEVRFAWVPSGEPCPAASPSAGTKPPQGQSGGAAEATAGTSEGTGPQTGATPPAPAGVAVSHTPPSGAPTTQTTIPGACGGTVYRTGAIPLAAP